MNSQIVSIDKHRFSGSDKFLIDTNVWMFINGPLSDAKNPTIAVYSSALKDILTANAAVYVDTFVISEFVNSYARLEHKKSSIHHSSTYKDFRKSVEFRHIASDIRNACSQILKIANITNVEFTKSDLSKILDTFGKEPCDFNDRILIDICKRQGYILVTHDIDSLACDIAVLTANKKMLTQASRPS